MELETYVAVQGYFLSKPIPADAFVAWLSDYERDGGQQYACEGLIR